MPVRYPKEQMHRIKYTKLSPEQIGAKLAAVNGPASVSAFSNAFAGVFENVYVRRDGIWTVQHSTYRSA